MENNNRQGCRWDWEDVFDNAQTMHLQEFKSHYESIEPCATSSENYWKQRCEAAEDYTYFAINNIYCEERESCYLKWKELKSTPMPIPTGDRDCEELKKEVERLKGLIDTVWWMTDNPFDSVAIAKFNKFKTENNL